MEAIIPRLFALQDSDNIFEAIITGLYRAILRPGDLVVDGGANHGLHSFPLAELVGPAGQVLAFEPIPTLAEALQQKATRRASTKSVYCGRRWRKRTATPPPIGSAMRTAIAASPAPIHYPLMSRCCRSKP